MNQSAASLLASLGKGRPWSAMVELSDRCNEACIHCYQVQGQKGEMSTDEAKVVFDKLADFGILSLTLSGGEVTLRRDFLELVRYARERGFAVKVFTNGLTMTEGLAQAIGALGVMEVQLSLYSTRAGVHDWVTRVPGSFESVVLAVKRLVAAGVHVVLKTPLMTINADDVDDYMEFARGIGADYAFDPELVPREDGVRDPTALRMDDEQLARVLRDARLSPLLSPAAAELDHAPCGVCSSGMVIEANGEVRPCAQLDVGLGDAVHDGIAAAWDSESAVGLRSLRWRDLHGCRECDLRSHCSRCFATARTESGDAFAPYESACRRALARYATTLSGATQSPGPIGPYREVSPGRLQTVAYELTEQDLAQRRTHAWSNRVDIEDDVPRAHPGDLVQLRRPARKARVECVP